MSFGGAECCDVTEASQVRAAAGTFHKLVADRVDTSRRRMGSLASCLFMTNIVSLTSERAKKSLRNSPNILYNTVMRGKSIGMQEVVGDLRHLSLNDCIDFGKADKSPRE